ncbi:ester cyclase [Haloterrigena sp. SYSU A558-1]|uniref:Ester cyclase n=1 Tax=Haloterrigena gelatinilytica TaxID=2741724 RepID=A0A8J8KF51_9EURY|nr:ester cyclase [Haloterrigena gelatinilytica]NUB91963.1 ester cyclase [Haloterrigena gelatinilytica]NUC72211.1 ester cyclase [Haloterrigena gelatinilytica]
MAETATDPNRLATEYATIWNEQEFSRLSEVVADSFTFTSPTAGTIEGREAFEAYAREITDAFPDFEITVHETLAGENLLMAEGTLSGTHEGEFDGIPPTGERFEIRDMARFVVEDGKLREERAFFDRQELFDQLGLLEE